MLFYFSNEAEFEVYVWFMHTEINILTLSHSSYKFVKRIKKKKEIH